MTKLRRQCSTYDQVPQQVDQHLEIQASNQVWVHVWDLLGSTIYQQVAGQIQNPLWAENHND